MEELLLDIVTHLRELPEGVDPKAAVKLEGIVREHNRGILGNARHLSKRRLLPFYLHVKQEDPERWRAWGIDAALERRLLGVLRVKPRRTASGVATITVITRPHPCSGDCVYCPCDLRMPKSYLWSEPACRRAEKNYFDPYLQVSTRLRALDQMGHATDKVELIVLGGTWTDYSQPYQIWFVRELFRALNEWPAPWDRLRERYAFYRDLGISNSADEIARLVAAEQARVEAGEESYNEGFARLYGGGEACAAAGESGAMSGTGARSPFWEASRHMAASLDELAVEQRRNETAAHRVVGLVIETRPDTIDPAKLRLMRRLGCTKIQLGIQSTRQELLDANRRLMDVSQIRRAFSLIRLFGFKIHAHFMVNLLGSTPEDDKADFRAFVSDPGFLPDEVKLYPCSLVAGTRLVSEYERGRWRPYTEGELLDVLVADTLATPPYVRISRMIRDISAEDILVGNKKANLRQMVEGEIARLGLAGDVRDIRFREIAHTSLDLEALHIHDYGYRTATTHEHFLEWVTPKDRIAGFLRLSLPCWDELASGVLDVHADELPVRPNEAMIREVHVYGQVAHLGRADSSSQHRGLGRELVERACNVARAAGYGCVNVISSVGTREYYRRLGFADVGLYQRREL